MTKRDEISHLHGLCSFFAPLLIFALYNGSTWSADNCHSASMDVIHWSVFCVTDHMDVHHTVMRQRAIAVVVPHDFLPWFLVFSLR